jgi:phage terminase large subunit
MLPNTYLDADSMRVAQEELAYRVRFEQYQQNPLLWLKERFGEDPKSLKWTLWGDAYEDHNWDGTKNPLAKAWFELARNKWVGLESATAIGKTYFLARVVYWFLDVFPNSLVVTTSASLKQLKSQFWEAELKSIFDKFKRIRPFAGYFNSLRILVDARGFEELAEDEKNKNAWGAVGIASDSSKGESSSVTGQGFHREHMLIIGDETVGIGHSSMEAYKNTSVGEHNVMLFVGNPDNQNDPLHNFCTLPNVTHIRASALDAPNVVLNRNVVPGAVTNKSIDDRRLAYGETSNMFLTRVRGLSPAQSIDSLIRLEWLERCLVSKHERKGTIGAVGVDVANSIAGDKAAVAFGEGNALLFLKDFQCPDASHLAYNLIYEDDELHRHGYTNYFIPTLRAYNVPPHRVGIDAVNVGVSTINTLNNHYKPAQVVSLHGGVDKAQIPVDEEGKAIYAFENLRAQMYWEFREDVRLENIVFAFDDMLTFHVLCKEITATKWVNKQGKIAIESKDDIKHRIGSSPNLADAVVYWNWVRKYSKKQDSLPAWYKSMGTVVGSNKR